MKASIGILRILALAHIDKNSLQPSKLTMAVQEFLKYFGGKHLLRTSWETNSSLLLLVRPSNQLLCGLVPVPSIIIPSAARTKNGSIRVRTLVGSSLPRVPIACTRHGSIMLRVIITDDDFEYCRNYLLGVVSC
ncbi:hypothetical protein YC2023_060615 [Brassica napus]